MALDIRVEPDVIEFVKRSGQDYRVSTSCSGPIIIPTAIKPPKDSDLKVKCGNNTLFISRVQARYVNHITMDMVYDANIGLSCSLYPGL